MIDACCCAIMLTCGAFAEEGNKDLIGTHDHSGYAFSQTMLLVMHIKILHCTVAMDFFSDAAKGAGYILEIEKKKEAK